METAGALFSKENFSLLADVLSIVSFVLTVWLLGKTSRLQRQVRLLAALRYSARKINDQFKPILELLNDRHQFATREMEIRNRLAAIRGELTTLAELPRDHVAAELIKQARAEIRSYTHVTIWKTVLRRYRVLTPNSQADVDQIVATVSELVSALQSSARHDLRQNTNG